MYYLKVKLTGVPSVYSLYVYVIYLRYNAAHTRTGNV
jgi:hypothetical protein